jgi:hypothetical protein
MKAADASFDSYLVFEGNKPTTESWEKAFAKIPAVANLQKQEEDRPWLKDLFYIQGILRNRSRAPRLDRIEYLEHIYLSGGSIEGMTKDAKRAKDFIAFEEMYDGWLQSIGRPF